MCHVWLKLAQWLWRRRFLNFVNVFSLFRNYSPLEKGGVLLLNKLESPLSKDALCQVWLKLALWFWRRFFKILSMYFRYFVIISHCKRVGPFIYPLSKNALCKVWLKLAQWFLGRNFDNVFSLFRNYFSFEKSGALHLK